MAGKHVQLTGPQCFSASQIVLANQSPHQLSNLAIYLKSYQSFETSKHRPRCLLVPPASQAGAGEFRYFTDRSPASEKRSRFVLATESRPARPRRGVLCLISDVRRARLCVPVLR